MNNMTFTRQDLALCKQVHLEIMGDNINWMLFLLEIGKKYYKSVYVHGLGNLILERCAIKQTPKRNKSNSNKDDHLGI